MFREFAMMLSVAILISLVVSLTTTPMMCAYIAIRPAGAAAVALAPGQRAACSTAMLRLLRAHPGRALRWPALVLVILVRDRCAQRLSVHA